MASNTAKRIGEFELIDHGIEHSQYFQGCGVAFTRFANVATGIGDNPAEAIDDCLEQVAQAGFDTEGMETRIMAQEGLKAIPTTPSVADEYGCDETGEAYYHVSIRWNEAKADNPAESRCDACGRTDCRNHACLDENLLPPHCRPL